MESNNSQYKLYVCGPTTYAPSHLGHARTYMIVDLINRVMTHFDGKKIFLVMNITDIDDKILSKASETNTNWTDIAKKYEKSFFDSMIKLNVQLPNVIIRVSEVIPEIVKYIQVIIDKGFAYVTNDGSVYFDTITYLSAGYTINENIDDDYSEISESIVNQKKNKKDFSLWKGRLDNEVGFDVKFTYNNYIIFSHGRPGWHIECSTMIHETLGNHFDIHFGGIDLKFPHHYNEIIQANAYHHPLYHPDTNKIWCNEFIHIGHLCIQGQKMSKSLKNFTTIDEALDTINSNEIRWMFMTHKWSDQMDFSDETIKYIKILDGTFINFFNRIINYPFDKNNVKYNQAEIYLDNFYYKTNIDIITKLKTFEFDLVVRALTDLINKTNSYISSDKPNEHLVRKIYEWIFYIVTTLGFVYGVKNNSHNIADILSVIVETRTTLREITRDKSVPKDIKDKLFNILDKERNVSLKNIGITLQDTKTSSSWFI